MGKLTPKQEKFIDYYIQTGGNATQAAISAGYSPKTAYSIGNENLNKPEIKDAIEKRLNKLQNERTADTQEILENLTAILRSQAQEEVILVVKGNIQKLSKSPSVKDRLRAMDIMCRISGLYQNDSSITVSQQTPIILVDDVRE